MSNAAESGSGAYKGKPIRIHSDVTVRQGFTAILRAGVDHLVKNQGAALNGGGIECIHQMRVALRQLRATLALFKDVVTRDEAARITLHLKWLSSRLGGARDWDVFETRTLPNVQRDMAKHAAAKRIAQATHAPRRAADRRAMAAIASARYGDLVRILKAWVTNAQWCEHLDPAARPLLEEPLLEAGRPWLRRSARKAHPAGKGIQHLTAEHRHRLRIALKQLRYDTHSLSSLYPEKKVKPYVDALSGLQDVLGDLNDLAVARRLLRQMKGRDCSVIDKELKVAKVVRLKNLEPAWRAFRNIPPFWK